MGRERSEDRDPLVRPGRFQLGRLLMTPGVQASVPPTEMLRALRRHARCDWGDVHPDDRGQNELALERGERILSVYRSESGEKFWIITEADRSATTVLLPDEY